MSLQIPARSSIISASLPDMDVLSDAELISLVNELKKEIRVINLENEILEKVILRLEPALMHGVYQALEYATRMHSNSSLLTDPTMKSQPSKFGLESIANPSRIMGTPSRVSTRRAESLGRISGTFSRAGPKINILEKAELLSAEKDIMEQNLEKVREKAEKEHAMLRAKLEEVGLRVSDIQKASELFREEVLIAGWDRIAQRIPAEIWIKFMTEWSKKSDKQVGKLRLRTSTLNSQYARLKGQVKVTAELSESLRPVDFAKLEIENAECLKIIEQKLQQLGELKKMTGDANLTLAVHKKALMEQNNYLTKVTGTKKKRDLQRIQLDKEFDLIKVQADILGEKLNKIRKLRADFQAPNIMDYVHVKWVANGLKAEIKNKETKLYIQRIALESLNKKIQKLVYEIGKSKSVL